MTRFSLLAAGAALFVPASLLAQSAGGEVRPGPEATIVGHVNKFRQLDPTTEGLRLPEGFRADIVAQDLGNARMIAVADNGTVYFTRRAEADVQMLVDENRDGFYEGRRTVAARPNMHGIAIDGDTMYLVTIKEVFSAPILADGTLGELELLADDLPDAGQHPNRTIAVGPDDMLYISVGSTCNACAEDNPENATIVRMAKDGARRTIFASGLRNTIGFDWNPRDGQLWGMDHGIDWLGDEIQPEEVNRIDRRARYGWPYVWGEGGENPQDYPPGGLTMADWKEMSRPMVAGWTAHAAPMQMAFNRGTVFPAAMQGDAFVAMRGSWNREEPAGYEVVRLDFDESGTVTAIEPFVSGFIRDTEDGGLGWTARPTGLAFLPDGRMLFGDPENGALYQVSYSGGDRPARPLAEAPAPDRSEPPRPLAMEEPATAADARLQVASSAFEPQGTMPMTYSAWGQDVSPPLRWSPGPEGTRSYAVIVEDPDAGTPQPIVHWLAWNIPADTLSLTQGVNGAPQLAQPEGMRQGTSARGSFGYFGPRPPVGDQPHGYHFQVFALDRELDLLPDASRSELVEAMEGRVLAKGELVGRYAQEEPPREE